jgi:hypothetical protein
MPIDFPNSPTTNATYTINGQSWRYNGTGWVKTTLNVSIPTQTGNSGRYLTTDGTTVSWAVGTPGYTGSTGAGYTGSRGQDGVIGYNGSTGYTGSAAAGSAGKIVQVAQTIVNYKQSTSNTSYTLLAAANAFTPTSAANKILVQITGQYGNAGTSGNGDIALYRTIGAGSATNQGQVINAIGGQFAAYDSRYMAISVLDSPATTSAVVYALYGIRTDGLAVPYIGGRNTDGYYQFGTYFTIMEVVP